MASAWIDWQPQKRQRVALKAAGVLGCVERGSVPVKPAARIIGYGGAAGGGKSDVLLVLAIVWCIAFIRSQVAFFRRTFAELEGSDGAIQRSHELLAPLVAVGVVKYSGDTHRWTFANGSTITFCHCQTDKDKYSYQGSRWDLLLIDEATHFTWEIVDYLLTRNGPTVDCVLQPLAVFATNPGNIGHLWYKRVFVDTRPWEQAHDVEINPGASERILFIQALLSDNQILDRRAEGAYRKTLESRSEDIRKALLGGDWDTFVGQYFKEFDRIRHVQPYRALPDSWPRFTGTDWGFAKPFATVWLAQDPDRGRVYVYREVYEVGLTDRAQARLIRTMTPPAERIRMRYADPSMWAEKNVEDRTFSTFDEYKSEGVLLTKADNERVLGWSRIRTFMADLADGDPGLIIFENCDNLIRTIGAMPYAKSNPDDIDTMAEDHAVDALRYATTSLGPIPRFMSTAQREVVQIGRVKIGGHRGALSGKDF